MSAYLRGLAIFTISGKKCLLSQPIKSGRDTELISKLVKMIIMIHAMLSSYNMIISAITIVFLQYETTGTTKTHLPRRDVAVIFILQINIPSTSHTIACRTLSVIGQHWFCMIQIMIWYCLTTSHYPKNVDIGLWRHVIWSDKVRRN